MQLKPMTINEKDLILEWRNHPETWKYFFDANPVKKEDHEKWFASTLNSNKRKVFICFNPDPVGMVRFDFRDNDIELSWTMAPDQRGKGYGVPMLQLAVKQFPGTILAKIKKENVPSIKIALKAGFVLDHELNDCQVFRYVTK